jgi:EAL domain-containing protein (putative c-di-GMP-specific phosphodiesterase class I)/GGDEF domain-containing protein
MDKDVLLERSDTMNDYEHTKMNRLLYPSTRYRMVLTVLIILMITAVYGFIYLTGGTKSGGYIHVMYIPVILGGVLYGWQGGVFIGILSGVVLGPLMPLNTETLEVQSIYSWGTRLLFFSLAGGLIGFMFETVREKMKQVTTLYTHDLSTGIKTFNHYWKNNDPKDKRSDRVSISFHINNYESLLVLLGSSEYAGLLKNVYLRIKDFLPKDSAIYLTDRRLFWIDTSKESFKTIRDHFSKTMEEEIIYSESVPLYLDFSIGVSIPDTKKNVIERFKESDIAALHAKRNGLTFVVYRDEHAKDSMLLERLGELPSAIENEEFFLVYQPIIDLKTDTVSGAEALIRWRKDDKVLAPIEFVPLAEETRLIDSITEWVLGAALKDHSNHAADLENIEIAINVSYRNFFNASLIEKMISMIKESQLGSNKLHIEMTESTLMKNRTTTQVFLTAFRNEGVKTILDDFGTGYSSLSCLRDLPVDIVKIDREFTMNMMTNRSMYDMIATIIELAHKLNLKVIAEGVEDESVLNELKTLGCDFAQGYYYSKPVEVGDLVTFIGKRKA